MLDARGHSLASPHPRNQPRTPGRPDSPQGAHGPTDQSAHGPTGQDANGSARFLEPPFMPTCQQGRCHSLALRGISGLRLPTQGKRPTAPIPRADPGCSVEAAGLEPAMDHRRPRPGLPTSLKRPADWVATGKESFPNLATCPRSRVGATEVYGETEGETEVYGTVSGSTGINHQSNRAAGG